MNAQPEALRLAELLDEDWGEHHADLDTQAAAELRRLHAVNQELLEALVDVMFRHVPFLNKAEYAEKARTAIAKATGGQA